MKTQRSADLAVGVLVALLGLFVLAASTWISVAGVHRLSPRTFPYAVAILLCCCGVGLALKAATVRNEGGAIAWPDREGVRTIVVTLAAVAGYIALLNPLGLPLATALYLTLAIWYLNRARWLVAVLIGLVTGGIAYYVFIRLLGLSFPTGPFLE